MQNGSQTAVARLTKEIEAKLAWGKGNSWSSKDFEDLSDRIFSETGKKISITTLKRVWGRTSNSSRLSHTTLDILAQYTGFENWNAFRQIHRPEEAAAPGPAKKQGRYRIAGMIGLALLVPAAILVLSQARVSDAPPKLLTEAETAGIQFDFEKVTVGYPNTVLFRYDIGDIPYDSLQIQQSWDTSRRMKLDSSAGLVTSTYYRPGYYLAKLVVNNQIVREKDLYIPTDGWRSIIGGNVPNFSYVKEGQLLHDSTLRFQPAVLEEMNRYPFAKLFLSNLSNDPQIRSDNMVFESEFRLAQPTDKSICQTVTVIITGAKDVLLFQFSIPGCVGDLMFALNGNMVYGNNHDLTAFGVDPTEWIDFKVTTSDNFLEAFISDRKIFEYQLPADIGMVGGVTFAFEGLGEVRRVRMHDGEGELVL